MWFRLYSFLIPFLALSLLPVSPLIAAPVRADQAFSEGKAAFQAGRYEAALAHFLAARRAGKDTEALAYNIGVTFYRLGRYTEAKDEFRRLLRDARLAPVAHYNLGLIALKQADEVEAGEHFRRARDMADSPGLRRLATRALATLRPQPVRRGSGLFSVAAGYDSNATLIPEDGSVAFAKEGDTFAEVLAAFRRPLTDTLELEGGLYALEYADLDAFGQTSLRLGLLQRERGERWERVVGAHLDRIWLGGEGFMSIATGTAQASRRFGPRHEDELRLRYRISRIEAERDFEQLTGWRHRLGARARWQKSSSSFTLGYEFEFNDRRDLARDGEFFSASPLRHDVRAEWVQAVAGSWEASIDARYRRSEYRDPDVRQSLIFSGSPTREDDEYGWGLRLGRPLAGAWHGFGRYAFTENQSNFPEFAYQRQELMLGVERLF